MERINKLLNKSANKYSLSKVAESSRICFVAEELSNGEYKPISFKNGILTLKTTNYIVAQSLQLNSEKLIKKINDKLNNRLVKRIKFRIN